MGRQTQLWTLPTNPGYINIQTKTQERDKEGSAFQEDTSLDHHTKTSLEDLFC